MPLLNRLLTWLRQEEVRSPAIGLALLILIVYLVGLSNSPLENSQEIDPIVDAKERSAVIEIDELRIFTLRALDDVRKLTMANGSPLLSASSRMYNGLFAESMQAIRTGNHNDERLTLCQALECDSLYWATNRSTSQSATRSESACGEIETLKSFFTPYQDRVRAGRPTGQAFSPIAKDSFTAYENCRKYLYVDIKPLAKSVSDAQEQVLVFRQTEQSDADTIGPSVTVRRRNELNNLLSAYNSQLRRLRRLCSVSEAVAASYVNGLVNPGLAENRLQGISLLIAGVSMATFEDCLATRDLKYYEYVSVKPKIEPAEITSDRQVSRAAREFPGFQLLAAKCVEGISSDCVDGSADHCGNLMLLSGEDSVLLAMVDPPEPVAEIEYSNINWTGNGAEPWARSRISHLICRKDGYHDSSGFLSLAVSLTNIDKPLYLSQEEQEPSNWQASHDPIIK